jgi:small GTP-binding protein
MVNFKRHFFKVLIVGDGGVGKTSLLHRFIFGEFLQMKMTVGTDIRAHSKDFDSGIKLELQLWDFAGEERFRIFLPSYCRGAKACLLCYDITRSFSFQNLVEWHKIVKDNANNPIFFLIGCKNDLERNFRAVEPERAKEFQNEYKINQFFETSSKSGYNNKEIFDSVMDSLYHNYFVVKKR